MIVDPAWYDKLKPAIEDEEFMLDLAHGLTRTSRLGCQIVMTDALDGLGNEEAAELAQRTLDSQEAPEEGLDVRTHRYREKLAQGDSLLSQLRNSPELLNQIKRRFAKVGHAKPEASRKDSREIYLIAQGFRPD